MSKISTVVAKQIEQFFFKQILKNVFKEKNCLASLLGSKHAMHLFENWETTTCPDLFQLALNPEVSFFQTLS